MRSPRQYGHFLERGCAGRALCSYTHPVLEGEARALPSLKELRRHLASARDLHFCDVCLDARKVCKILWGLCG